MDAEITTGFEIDGERYEIPTLDTLNMDEAEVLYDYCGVTLEDFILMGIGTPEEIAESAERRRNPKFTRALVHIAYQRKHLDLPAAEVKDLIAGANFLNAYADLLRTLLTREEDEQSPPESTSEPSEALSSGSLANEKSQSTPSAKPGESSQEGLGVPGVHRVPTTRTRSGTSSTSPPISSVA